MSENATKSTLGQLSAQWTSSVPRSPTPMMPMRARSLAPKTPCDEARVEARPVAIVPMNLRRESIGVPFYGSILSFPLSFTEISQAGDRRKQATTCATPALGANDVQRAFAPATPVQSDLFRPA